MEYRAMRGTGMTVSRACLGTMTFGGQNDQKQVDELVAIALDGGVTFFDTADFYIAGESEKMLAKALGSRRKEICLTSKVGNQMGEVRHNRGGLSRKWIMTAIDETLSRLETDYVDLYFMHIYEQTTPLEESLSAMSDLVKAGKIRYYGMSNYPAWEVCRAQWLCEKNGFVAPVTTQVVYNMLTRGIEQEFLPFVEKQNVGVTVYNPLMGGLLTGKYSSRQLQEDSRFGSKRYAFYLSRYWNEENLGAVDKLIEIAKDAGIAMTELALRWCVSQPLIDSLVMGATKPQQLLQNIAAFDKGPLSKDVLDACDEVWNAVAGTRMNYIREI